MKMNSSSYYTSAQITLALTLDTTVMDIPVDCRYSFYPASQMDEHSPVEPEHVKLNTAYVSDGRHNLINIINILARADSMIDAIEATLLEIELNNQE